MQRVLKAANPEFFVLVALALGAFLGGLLVSESDAAHQTMRHLLPLRDAFVALFFVTMGILVNPRILISRASLVLVIVGLVVEGKLVVWTVVVKLFRYPVRTALKVGSPKSGNFPTCWCGWRATRISWATTCITPPWPPRS